MIPSTSNNIPSFQEGCPTPPPKKLSLLGALGLLPKHVAELLGASLAAQAFAEPPLALFVGLVPRFHPKLGLGLDFEDISALLEA